MMQLVSIDKNDWKRSYIKDDPVRPHLSEDFRMTSGREIFGLENEGVMSSVICVAYTNEVPEDEYQLDLYSQAACQDGQKGNVAVFYTVWSYSKGAGREIIFNVADYMREEYPHIKRFVTLSPLTEMAEKFHTKNGAKLIFKGRTCQNFEYTF